MWMCSLKKKKMASVSVSVGVIVQVLKDTPLAVAQADLTAHSIASQASQVSSSPSSLPSSPPSSSPPRSIAAAFSLLTLPVYFPLSRASKMLKFWPTTPVDLTPKPGPNGQERQNPFENPAVSHPPSTEQPTHPHTHPSSSTFSSTSSSTPSGRSPPHTPTATTPSYHHQLLHTHHHLPLSPSIAPAVTTPQALTNDHKSHTLISHPLTPPAAAALPTRPTTGLSLHAPVFNMQQPPPPKRSILSATATSTLSPRPPSSPHSSMTSPAPHHHPNGSSTPTTAPHPSSSPRGQIHVKLISARGLNVRSSRARPYVVVQFEQNEFISRDPTDEYDKEVKGIPTNLSRNSSSTALSALGAITTKANRAAATPTAPSSRKGSTVHTPSSSNGSTKHPPLGISAHMFGSRISSHNPVWKHEVSLYASSPFILPSIPLI